MYDMASRTERTLDSTDWQILQQLQADARLSFNEIGRRVGLSAPAVAERVRRLEDAGIVTGYHARVDPAKVGLGLTAFIQLRCGQGRCLLKTTQPEDYPEVEEIHKLSGDSCSMLKVRAASMPHLEAIIERLGQHGEMRTSIVLSSPLERRAVAVEQIEEGTDMDRAHVWGR
jgi:Lrp/AsnC family transcriptional regulator, leucine-responsive regulatory protein